MNTRAFVIGVGAALLFAAPAGYALQEFTLEEAQTRIERLEARVAALEEALAGGTTQQDAEATQTVEGTLFLFGEDSYVLIDTAASGRYCVGDNGYDNLRGGAAVRVLDETGDTIASSSLEDGREAIEPGLGKGCQFTFSVDVPDAAFYEFQVAGRGAPNYSREEMEANDWTLALSIGN